MRDGRTYIESLGDSRRVYLDGKLVSDVRKDPAFRGIIQSIARMYDYSSDPSNGMSFDTQWGTKANKVFMIPRSREDIRERHRAIYKWAQLSMGFVGRSPDHVGSFLAGFASDSGKFAREGRPFQENVERFYRKLLDEDLYVTYAIIPPQIDRSKTAGEQENHYSQVGVVKEVDGGIIVRGGQMLATGTAVSDYLLVSCITPLKEGDEDQALTFYLPVDTEGLKLYCRRPYSVNMPSVFDYPMSTRFDESDAFVVFDDVFVPWENIFVYRDIQGLRTQFFGTFAHVLGNNQAQIRLSAKIKFLVGLARKATSMNGIDRIPAVMEKLGELASLSAIVEGMIEASESTSIKRESGIETPNPRFLYGAMGLQAELYPRVLHVMRELVGAGVLQVPSSKQELLNPETRKDMDTYIKSPGYDSENRIKLFKLIWDVLGSEFAGRHHQYEMFYAGAPFVAKTYSYRNYGYEEATESVDSFLQGYDLNTEI